MTLKKDSKKHVKSSKNKKILQKLPFGLSLDNLKRMVAWDGLSVGDKVLSITLILVIIFTVVFAARTTADTYISVSSLNHRPNYGLRLDRKPAPPFGVARAKGSTGLVSGNLGVGQVKVPIIMYHRIDTKQIPNDRYSYGLTVPPTNFDAQMEYLEQNGYTVVGLEDLYRTFYSNETISPKTVILTFDDGFSDNYTYAYPILKKHHFNGTFFVATGFTDANKNYLTTDQIKEMSAGGMDIESHTVGHPDLTKLKAQELNYQLVASRERIEKITGKKSYFFAYPYGSNNENVIQAVQNAGYLLAITTKQGKVQNRITPFGLTRVSVGPGTTLATFAKLVQ
jgi:peptidoglycan/xylan/chitin deacetylase (PgdA/CDA1 family)